MSEKGENLSSDENACLQESESFQDTVESISPLHEQADLESSAADPPADPCQSHEGKTTKIFIRQIPPDVDWKEFDELVRDFGEVVDVQHTGSEEKPSALVVYKHCDEAQNAISGLEALDFHGTSLKASYWVERRREGRNARGPGGDTRLSSPFGDLPLRMVVAGRFVGAIIGQGGENIREITKQSKARCIVDTSRGIRDEFGNVEKVVSIFGVPENCSAACSKVLEILAREAAKEQAQNSSQPELKLRAHNNLVGRLIGRQGSTVKQIMQESGCNVSVSNYPPGYLYGRRMALEKNTRYPHCSYMHDRYDYCYDGESHMNELNAFNPDRTIIVRGDSIEKLSAAEALISAKLRQSYANDMTNMGTGGGYTMQQQMPMGSCIFQNAYGYSNGTSGPILNDGSHGFYGYGYGQQRYSDDTKTVHMNVPNSFVGGLIGPRGIHVRSAMRLTGANIRIETQSKLGNGQVEGEGGDQFSPASATERLITIVGTEEQTYRAQYWVFQRLSEQSYRFFEEIQLCTELRVPSTLIGRIIGKGGKNVKELTRLTGAQIKIPEDASASEDAREDAVVRIIGNYNASQAVQRRIWQHVDQFFYQQSREDKTNAHKVPNKAQPQPVLENEE